MTQANDLGQIANQAGATYRNRVNVNMQALGSFHQGGTEPSVMLPNMLWFDTQTGLARLRNPSNTAWTTFGSVGPPFEIYNKGIPLDGGYIVGEVRMFSQSASQLPNRWIPTDGRALSRSGHILLSAIYAAQGYPYGAGDGSTTFNVPDIKGRAPIGVGQGSATGENGTPGTNILQGAKLGAETHTLTIQQMPAHSHTGTPDNQGGQGGGQAWYNKSGQTSSVGGGQAHNNMQPSIGLTFAVYAGLT